MYKHKNTQTYSSVHSYLFTLLKSPPFNLPFTLAENTLMENVEKCDMIRDYVLKVCRKHL